MSASFVLTVQAAPAAAEKKTNGAAAAAVQAVENEATPSHDVYGHLPKPEENDKVCPLSYQGICMWGGGGRFNTLRGVGTGRGLYRSCSSGVNSHASKLKPSC